jgi:hypothetical protein
LDDAAEAALVDLPAALPRLLAFGFYLDAKLLQFLLDRDSARTQRKTQSQRKDKAFQSAVANP